MKLLYGTSNEGKLTVMRRALEPMKNIQIIGLKEIEAAGNIKLPEIEESGSTPLENARIKALAYYQVLKIPVFSCDSGLYFDGLPHQLQPGIHVRTIHGKRFTDEEMTSYYAGLARQYGPLTGRYKNAVCLVLDENHIYESVDDALSGEAFLLIDTPHPRRQEGFPLDCLSKHILTGEYYYDMGENCQDDVAMDSGFRNFFQSALDEYEKITKKR